ncbi:MAG: OmpA family protein [Limisphaerales bacterium]
MNRPFFRALTFALIAATAFAAFGCKRKAQRPITPLADNSRGATTAPARPGGPAPLTEGNRVADPFAGGAGVASNADGSTGLPAGRLDRSAFNEDRAALATSTVFFDFDSSVVRSSEQGKVDAVAAFLAGSPGAALEIEGHTDERGTQEYNRALGERRALAVREVLIARGVNADRLFTISFGEDRPAVDGSDESAWSRNRRAEFVVLTPR